MPGAGTRWRSAGPRGPGALGIGALEPDVVREGGVEPGVLGRGPDGLEPEKLGWMATSWGRGWMAAVWGQGQAGRCQVSWDEARWGKDDIRQG